MFARWYVKLGLVAVIIVLVGVTVVFPARERTREQLAAEDVLLLLVREHPDRQISHDLYAAWSDGQVWVMQTRLVEGNGVQFVVLSKDIIWQRYGRRIKGEAQPIILVGRNRIRLAEQDEREARSLQAALSHEYAHYGQWLRGEAFHEPPDTRLDEAMCQAIWSREYPVYRDECLYVRAWWPDPTGVLPDRQCNRTHDPVGFAQDVVSLLGERQPDCLSTWGYIVQDIRNEQARHQ